MVACRDCRITFLISHPLLSFSWLLSSTNIPVILIPQQVLIFLLNNGMFLCCPVACWTRIKCLYLFYSQFIHFHNEGSFLSFASKHNIMYKYSLEKLWKSLASFHCINYLLGNSLKFGAVIFEFLQLWIEFLSWSALIVQNILARYISDEILKHLEGYKK